MVFNKDSNRIDDDKLFYRNGCPTETWPTKMR